MSRPDHCCDASAELAHLQQIGHRFAQGPVAVVGVGERDLRHGVVQHPDADWMAFGVVRVEQSLSSSSPASALAGRHQR